MEMLHEFLGPYRDAEGTYVFSAPIGMSSEPSLTHSAFRINYASHVPMLIPATSSQGTGAVPLIHLDDLGEYARWIFDNPSRSVGMDLEIATQHVGWAYLAETFTNVTGKPARFQDMTPDEYFTGPNMKRSSPDSPAQNPEGKVAYGRPHLQESDKTVMTFRQNFSGFWQLWKNSGDNKGVIRRDYALLDEILPGRVKTVGEWMEKVSYDGEKRAVLKDVNERARAAKQKQEQRL